MAATDIPPEDRRERVRRSLNDRLSRPAPTVWLSGQEAAEHVGVSWPTLLRMIRDYGIPHLRAGRRYMIELAVLDEHLRRIARGGSTS